MLTKILESFGYHRKESRVNSALIQLGLDLPIWTPRDYESLTRIGYQLNADVYACVNLIARSAKQVPWLVTKTKDGAAVSNSHPLVKLLQKPNEFDTDSDFKESSIAYLLLSGNTYIERSGGNENAPPVFLYSHRPDRFQIIKGSRRQVVGGYQYSNNGVQPVRFAPWEILHLKLFNPLDDWYGMSPIEAAAYTIDNSNESASLYKRLLQKGYPPGAVSIKGVDWTDDQVRDFKLGLRRSHERGEILVLQDAEWKEMGFKPVDASIFQGKLFQKRDIAAVYGVPSGMIGDTQVKTYANSREERRSLYSEAVIPSLTKLRDGLNNWLGPLYDGAYIDIDKDAIDALAEDREVQAKRVALLFTSNVITQDEARAELGYEPAKDGERLSNEITRLNLTTGTQGNPQAQGPLRNGQTPAPAAATGTEDNVVAINSRRKDLGFKAFNLLSVTERDSHWKAFDSRRELWELRIASDVASRFDDERDHVLKAYRDHGEQGAIRMVAKQEDKWHALYKDFTFGIAEDFGRRTTGSLKADGVDYEVKFELDIFTRTVLAWLSTEGARRVVGILDVTRSLIRKELAAGVAAGEGIFELSKRLQAMYGSFSNVRAERIARTEVISASNLGSQTAAKATNLPLEKEWLATPDDRTRDPHWEANGQKRSIDEPYLVMGQRLMFPGDGSLGATAENLIQCRCTETYRVKRG